MLQTTLVANNAKKAHHFFKLEVYLGHEVRDSASLKDQLCRRNDCQGSFDFRGCMCHFMMPVLGSQLLREVDDTEAWWHVQQCSKDLRVVMTRGKSSGQLAASF
jgi:hypothetical protein